MNQTGAYHYLCTRNNNFSNRQQKGRILVVDGGVVEFEIGKRGGASASADGAVSVSVAKNVFQTVVKLRLETRFRAALAAEDPALARSIPQPAISGFVTVTPADLRLDDNDADDAAAPAPMKMTIRLNEGRLGDKIPQVLRDDGAGGWRKIDSFFADDGAIEFGFHAAGTFYVAEGGNRMPPAPASKPPPTPSASARLLDRICRLFGGDFEEWCRAEVRELRGRGVDDLFIGRQLLAALEEKVVDNLKDSVASPAKKRELVMDVLDMFDEM